MGFSLETSIIMPLALALFVNGSSLCIPEAVYTRYSSSAAVQSVIREINPPHLYRLELTKVQKGMIPVLKSSPQKMVESLSLYRDLKFLVTDKGD
ncbi:MAG TPA: hypothetical protein GXX72_08600 [Clostridiaceae bacterium]|nr:hypothetical protein [Clostridiaceae bacterium]